MWASFGSQQSTAAVDAVVGVGEPPTQGEQGRIEIPPKHWRAGKRGRAQKGTLGPPNCYHPPTPHQYMNTPFSLNYGNIPMIRDTPAEPTNHHNLTRLQKHICIISQLLGMAWLVPPFQGLSQNCTEGVGQGLDF